MASIKFSGVLVIMAIIYLSSYIEGHPTRSSEESDSSSDSDDAKERFESKGPYKRRVVKVLDVDLAPDDYTPQELNLDELKDHPNYQEIKNLDKDSLRAITMLARKKRRVKRNTLPTMLRYERNTGYDSPLFLAEKGEGGRTRGDDKKYNNYFL